MGNKNSIIKFNINWNLYFLLIAVIRVCFIDLSMISFSAVMISVYQFLILFDAIGKKLPIRSLFGSFMCLQMLIGPVLAYNGLDDFQTGYYKMQLQEVDYFVYVIPAVLLFIWGMNIRFSGFDDDHFDELNLIEFIKQHPRIPYVFVIIGFVSSVVSPFFSNDFGFLFYLIGGFKFIGAFMLLFSKDVLKPIVIGIVFLSIMLSSIRSAMFHDLLIWLIFFGLFAALRYKPNLKLKLIFLFGFMFLAVAIQLIKFDYRTFTWKKGEDAGIETLEKTIVQKQNKTGFFNADQLAQSNLRINQGVIVTNVMRNVPSNIPFSNGEELLQVLEASIMPRFVVHDKLNAGDRNFFMKWSGMVISNATSMGISSIGDAYVNFGVIGGAIFMFFYGLLFSKVIAVFQKKSDQFPILLLMLCLVFYYPIRPDCEMHTILGHLFKSSFLIWMVIVIWKRYFYFVPVDLDD